MPRLTKGMNTQEVAAARVDTWKAIKIGGGTLGGSIPSKARLTTMVIQVTDKDRRADGFKFGLSEDESGNHPITGCWRLISTTTNQRTLTIRRRSATR